MQAIVDAIGALVNGVITLGEMGIWLFAGLIRLGDMMTKSIGVFGTVLRFFPAGVVSLIIAVCGGLIVLRIFGRS